MIPPGYTLISRAYDQFAEIDSKQAFGWLKWQLVKGHMTAFTFFDNDEEHEIPISYWRRLSDQELADVFKTGNQFIDYSVAEFIEEARKVVVNSEKLFELLAQRKLPGDRRRDEVLPSEPLAKRNKGGRVTKSAGVLIEAVALLWHAKEEDFPEPADLFNAALDAWVKKGNAPISIDTARNMITPLHRRWRADFR